MARLNEGSSFDAICPELVDRILDKLVVAEGGANWRDLASVNKAFRESACRCSQTLVIGKDTSSGPWCVWPNTYQLNLQVADAASGTCNTAQVRALRKEIALHPRLSGLLIKDRLAAEGLWPAVSRFRWTSFVGHQGEAWHFFALLSGAKVSLKKLVLNLSKVTRSLNLYDDILRIVRAFPNLEELTLGIPEGTNCSGSSTWRPDDGKPNKLHSITFSEYYFPDWWRAFELLPSCLTNLTKLSFQCYDRPSVLQPPVNMKSLFSYFTLLQTVSIDVRSGEAPFLLLENVAAHCPGNLRNLRLFVPAPSDHSPSAPGALSLSKLQNSCPELERLIISCGEVATLPKFKKLVLESGLERDKDTGSKEFLESLRKSALVLEETKMEIAPESMSGRSCSTLDLTMFRFIVPVRWPWSSTLVRQSGFDKKQRLLGEERTVQSWCDAFCYKI